MGLLVKIIITIIIIAAILFLKTIVKLNANKKLAEIERGRLSIRKFDSPGTVESLRVFPLIDYYASDSRYRTEAGVAYYIEADDTKILLDTGANFKKKHPSPLLENFNTAGINPEDLDFIFLSHLHMDHIGGLKDQKKKTFSLSAGSVKLPSIPVFSPEPVIPSDHNPGPEPLVIKEPYIIKNGIASIGVIPRALYILGYTLENTLAFNVKNKGIVLVIGCGHQSIEQIVERAQHLFDEPIYGIIGGLHLPSGNGRMRIGPIDVQSILGTDNLPWRAISEKETEDAIQVIKELNPTYIALSPHDSSDWSLERFRETFKEKYHDIKVGETLFI